VTAYVVLPPIKRISPIAWQDINLLGRTENRMAAVESNQISASLKIPALPFLGFDQKHPV